MAISSCIHQPIENVILPSLFLALGTYRVTSSFFKTVVFQEPTDTKNLYLGSFNIAIGVFCIAQSASISCLYQTALKN